MTMSPPLCLLRVFCVPAPGPLRMSGIKPPRGTRRVGAMLLSIWGRVAGWSEFAIRALSLFVGLLTLAWVYRTGRDFFTPAAGLIAALLLSASVFHLVYMTRNGSLCAVSLCVAICIWYYWRVALYSQQPGRGAQAGLLLGSIGLLYSHYLGALLLPVSAWFHLLFVPKNRAGGVRRSSSGSPRWQPPCRSRFSPRE